MTHLNISKSKQFNNVPLEFKYGRQNSEMTAILLICG